MIIESICAYVITQSLGYLIQIIPVSFLFYAPYKQSILRFPKKRLLFLLNLAFVLIVSVGTVYLGHLYKYGYGEELLTLNANLIMSVCLLLGSLVYFFSFRKESRGKTLLYMIVIQYAMLVYVSSSIVAKFVPTIIQKDFSPYSVKSLVIYIGVTALTFPFIYHFLKKGNVQSLVQVNRKELGVITGCSIAILVMMIIAFQMEVGLDVQTDTFSADVYTSVWMLCFMAGDVLAYFIYFVCLILEKEKEDIHLRLISYQHQYKQLSERIESDKRERHNLRHHLVTMSVLLQEGQEEKLGEYLQQYLSEVEKVPRISDNPMLNEVLGYYVVQAENNGIDMKCSIHVRKDYSFNIRDLTVLFGNALENAINACSTYEGSPYIHVMVRQRKKSIFIKIENSATCPSGKVASSYGLDSIDMIAKKYQGIMEVWPEEEKFTLRVILNIVEEDKG